MGQLIAMKVGYSSTIRNETLDGQDWIVAPGVFLVEGVHNGSGGRIYYPADVISNSVESWNMKPVYIGHPEINGELIGGSDLRVLDTRIGFLRGMSFDGNKLRGEVWIYKSNESLLSRMVEVSTGMFVDVNETVGNWNGENYDAVAVNIRTDHLALLPNDIGACSISDGAGCPRVNKLNKEGYTMAENTITASEPGVPTAVTEGGTTAPVALAACPPCPECSPKDDDMEDLKKRVGCVEALLKELSASKSAPVGNKAEDDEAVEALAYFRSVKEGMVNELVGNKRNKFTKEELHGRSMGELLKLTDMVKEVVMVGNAQRAVDSGVSPLPIPAMFK